ncbi:adenosylmethionine--8-amino-7-oxononanoate transaminase [Reinekea marinisedimentorum]|uniref:Adenosylmethionine-8-amino-7-oxononanoate aminotransferase n=1 Tax=Reinekea marinisedimentorum TaxID=230495 RepID=A0A4R3I7Q9_9GAMM|nr:adenosylmethionine--8-amino-7-oxononanoate transaminase [Reinekea marinisedimentorum]TCS41325.1 adenosylmethionine-8-amino-7-oxononanoate aminotransferase [Reinekea marinisedimentorum]
MAIDLEFDKNHLWHPYTSTTHPLPCYPVESASGVRIKLEDGTELIDGMASWWSAIHGYNVPALNRAIAEQSAKMAHVMFGGLTHEPAVELAKKLVQMTPASLQKVFLADSGSIAVEVAIKMALQYWQGRNKPTKNRLVTVLHGYHGDTFGAMGVCDPVNGMHGLFKSMLPETLFLEAIPQGFNLAPCPSLLAEMEARIAENADQLAAFIIEPVVQGAGGMRIYNPEWLKHIRAWCDKYDLLLICDEIATGFGRTGTLFACEHANVEPDILCLGKALSGGYMTLAATLASDEVAEGVCASEAGVFMHGPTFMGNPLACAVANGSLSIISEGRWRNQVPAIEQQLKAQLPPLENEASVSSVRVLGAIGVVEMQRPVNVAEAQKVFIEQGAWIRPFGKLIYIMPAYCMCSEDLQKLTQAIAAYAMQASV